MANRSIFIFLILITSCLFISNPCYSETDTLQQGQELKDWDELISSNRVFSLKFFSFGTTISPYLGLFYENNRQGGRDRSLKYWRLKDFRNTAVWVANRNNPVTDIYGKLVIDVHGKLSISSSGGTVLDLFSPTPLKIRNVSATLLDSGNLVLQERYPDGSVKQVLWQSFDYPTDTLLPGMKLGTNLKSGHRWSLTSWAGVKLPAHGSFTLSGDPNGTGQLVLLRRGNIRWMSGPWRNGQFENTDMQSSGSDVHLYYTCNETEQSFTYLTKTYNTYPVLRMYPDGQLISSTFKIDVTCGSINDPGCVEYDFEDLKCRENYYFPTDGELWAENGQYKIHVNNKYFYAHNYIYMDEYQYDERDNMTLYDCKRICWSNCSCTAYSYATKNGTACKTYAKMIYNPAQADRDMEYFPVVYGVYGGISYAGKKKKKWIWIVVVIGSLAPLIWLSCYLVYKKLHHVREKGKKIQKLLLPQLRRFYNYVRAHKEMNTELHYFTFQSISSATNSFSNTNKLGEGGFGAVYKGKLADGQEVAVKRLSRSSAQGVKEFKNETELIAKLQHINLVRLLGCCIEKQEKILVYEYMPNNSLDFFLFDSRKKGLLNWNSRFVIIDGIAQGLLYLHKFSRLRVIHRDLKASNILLDDYLKPKISDFGMAKLFGINESEANTSRVVGTRGYMPPEYLMEGTISTKIDVFGFGVLLLEIVSSKMNHGSYDVEHPLNLLGHAWELWNEGRGLELMDPVLEDSSTPKEVMTCIHVGLLCVQDNAADRPTMSEVISMLTNENMHLPEPKQPAFFIERQLDANTEKEDKLGNGSTNGQSISILVAR